MGLIIQHHDIIDYLENMDLYNGDELLVYVTLKTSKPLFVRMNYLNLENYIVEGAWLAFSEKDIKIIPVNQLGKLKEDVVVIPQNEIAHFSIKKNIILYTITLTDLEGNAICFRASSRVVGNTNHHEDFVKLLSKIG